MDTLFSMKMKIPGLLRPLQAQEFSDGQVRFLCLCAALLSPRPPSLLAVNEPETSLHPDILDALGALDRSRIEKRPALDYRASAALGRPHRETFRRAPRAPLHFRR